jgi:hypothetical protein
VQVRVVAVQSWDNYSLALPASDFEGGHGSGRVLMSTDPGPPLGNLTVGTAVSLVQGNLTRSKTWLPPKGALICPFVAIWWLGTFALFPALLRILMSDGYLGDAPRSCPVFWEVRAQEVVRQVTHPDVSHAVRYVFHYSSSSVANSCDIQYLMPRGGWSV